MERDNAPVFSSFRSCTTSCQGFHASLLIVVLLIRKCQPDHHPRVEARDGREGGARPPPPGRRQARAPTNHEMVALPAWGRGHRNPGRRQAPPLLTACRAIRYQTLAYCIPSLLT